VVVTAFEIILSSIGGAGVRFINSCLIKSSALFLAFGAL
jgi:hypothetical protein